MYLLRVIQLLQYLDDEDVPLQQLVDLIELMDLQDAQTQLGWCEGLLMLAHGEMQLCQVEHVACVGQTICEVECLEDVACLLKQRQCFFILVRLGEEGTNIRINLSGVLVRRTQHSLGADQSTYWWVWWCDTFVEGVWIIVLVVLHVVVGQNAIQNGVNGMWFT